jgi:hypothetical protein
MSVGAEPGAPWRGQDSAEIDVEGHWEPRVNAGNIIATMIRLMLKRLRRNSTTALRGRGIAPRGGWCERGHGFRSR